MGRLGLFACFSLFPPWCWRAQFARALTFQSAIVTSSQCDSRTILLPLLFLIGKLHSELIQINGL